MFTEESLADYSLDELFQLLKVKLEIFELLKLPHADIKQREIARIELDLIEYVIEKRTAKRKP